MDKAIHLNLITLVSFSLFACLQLAVSFSHYLTLMKFRKLVPAILFPFCCTVLSAQNGIPYTNTSPFIVVDQFGYRPGAEKVAVIRNPIVGNDASQSFTPGNTYAVMDAVSEEEVFSGSIEIWNEGATHEQSGDQAWHFDFSDFSQPGTYYIKDLENTERSYEFEIREDVYREVFKHAFRVFFYQRAGFPKETPYADDAWADGASHIGPLQDKNARSYDAPGDAATERDIHGGWYDAGDLNRYTPWTAGYIHAMLLSFDENPQVWTDDFNIPESGNGVSDLLDELKWGLDHLLRMQNEDGSVLSVIGSAHDSPPSDATDPSVYGGINTVSALACSGTFAYAAKIYGEAGMADFAASLLQAAISAWEWSVENPDVIWRNNDASYGSAGVGAGQQETNDYGRFSLKMRAAAHLFEVTGDSEYQDFFEANYRNIHLFQWNFAFPFEQSQQQTLISYIGIPGASDGVIADIISTYNNAMESNENFGAHDDGIDPYRAHMKDYGWGSNGIKGRYGAMYAAIPLYGLNNTRNEDAWKAAERYVHYLHGVNPQSRAYLTNMYEYGGDFCANQIYHTWFANGNPLWDEVGVSVFGPAPGIVPGGPNPSYSWDGCCPSGCGSENNNAKCNADVVAEVQAQPDQKAYTDFNDSWPMNSWSVTENSMGYQVAYLRLLANFVAAPPFVLDLGDDDLDGLENAFETFFGLASHEEDLTQRIHVRNTPTKQELLFSYSKDAHFDSLSMEWSKDLNQWISVDLNASVLESADELLTTKSVILEGEDSDSVFVRFTLNGDEVISE